MVKCDKCGNQMSFHKSIYIKGRSFNKYNCNHCGNTRNFLKASKYQQRRKSRDIDWKGDRRKGQVRELVPHNKWSFYYKTGWRAGTRFKGKGNYYYRYFYKNRSKKIRPHELQKARWNKARSDYKFKKTFRKYYRK